MRGCFAPSVVLHPDSGNSGIQIGENRIKVTLEVADRL